MKKTITLLFFTLSVLGYSQIVDYRNAPSTPNSNYYDIVNKAKQKTASKKVTGKATRTDIKAEKQFERWAYFWKDRVNADGSFPKALQGWENAGLLENNTETTKKQNTQSKTNVLNWSNIGPQTNPNPNGYAAPPQLGRVNTFWRFAVTPNSSSTGDILIVGTPTGGIWKSTDNGANWSPKFDTFAGIGITDIKGSSSVSGTPGALYATTGDYDSSGTLNAIGVYKSVDYGETWTATPGLSGNLSDTGNSSLLGHLVVIDANTVVVAAKNDILKTTDGGTTWTSKFNEFDGKFGRMASHGTNIVCTNYWGGIFYSLNSGDTWSVLLASGGSKDQKVVAVDHEGTNAGTFYVQGNDGRLQVLDLVNETISSIGTPRPATAEDTDSFGTYSSQDGYNQALTVRNGFFMEGAVAGQTSIDNGDTWYMSLNGYWKNSSTPGVFVHCDHHQMGYLNNGNSFWDAHDGGLDFIEFNSTPDLTTPNTTYKTNGVINTQIYAISINPTVANSDDFLMANQDNDGFSKEGGTWYGVGAGDGVCSAIDYNNTSIRYMGGTNGTLFRSYGTTGFKDEFFGDEVPKPGTGEFVWPFSLDTNTSTIAYGGFDDFYKSTNISTISLYPTPAASTIWTDLNAGAGIPLSFDNQGDNVAIVGETALRRSTDGGATWSTINQPSGVEINSFSIDGASTNGTTIYATAKAYLAGSKVYKSTDGGSTWTNISGNMPNVIMKKILFRQGYTSEQLFVGTELGVYFTTDGGTNWDKLGDNLPNVIVNDLKINYLGEKLFIGTYGRGMWEINISNLTLGLENLEANDVLAPKLYPNPVSNGDLNIKLPNNSEAFDYVIYNIVGGFVKKGKINQGNNIINVGQVSAGIYIVRMTNSKYVSLQKIIIK
ncbi:putative secreted protein (Por secretion system target) [Mariniflexile fucanivorans]|uniref:Putative secreted protein (Por secretion system target) n=1 Tax=Mariniflexile fucanivorans TaxID=264023 RepID=A0A4R1RKR0_9FLAO|nr:T9SS type A sorting domain-containing protein [Mariniflexile fucanivorans]TCL66788.1 putative secreted protein (Por secretion system target) [Mariniflexile fucanivorans]